MLYTYIQIWQNLVRDIVTTKQNKTTKPNPVHITRDVP